VEDYQGKLKLKTGSSPFTPRDCTEEERKKKSTIETTKISGMRIAGVPTQCLKTITSIGPNYVAQHLSEGRENPKGGAAAYSGV